MLRAKALLAGAALLLGVGRLAQIPLPALTYADPVSIQVPCDMVEANGTLQAQSCLIDTGTAGDMLLSPAEAQAIGAEPASNAVLTTTVAGTAALALDWVTVDVAGAQYRAEAMVFPSWTGGPVIGMGLLAKMGATMQVDFAARTVTFDGPQAQAQAQVQPQAQATATAAGPGLTSWQSQWLATGGKSGTP